jgi:hypothetical protein
MCQRLRVKLRLQSLDPLVSLRKIDPNCFEFPTNASQIALGGIGPVGFLKRPRNCLGGFGLCLIYGIVPRFGPLLKLVAFFGNSGRGFPLRPDLHIPLPILLLKLFVRLLQFPDLVYLRFRGLVGIKYFMCMMPQAVRRYFPGLPCGVSGGR